MNRTAVGAVDHPVIVRQRQRQHQPRHERAVLVHRAVCGARHAEDGDLGRVDDRRERRATDAAQARDREAAALHLGGRQLARPRLLAQRRQLARQLEHVLAVRVAHDRHDQPVGRVGREAHVHVVLHHQLAGLQVQRRAEQRKGLQRLHARAHHERQRRQLEAARRRLVLELHARGFHLGDVGLVELGHVRHVDPARVQPRARDLLDAAQRAALDRAERREVHRRHTRQRRAGHRRRLGQQSLDVRLDVLLGDPPLGTATGDPAEVHAQLARKSSDRRAGVRTSRSPALRRSVPPLPPSGRGLGRGGGVGSRGPAAGSCAAVWRRDRTLTRPWPTSPAGAGEVAARCALDDRDQVALRHAAAALHLQLADHARHRGRHVHRGLFSLERDQRGVDRHRVARLHRDVR